MHISSKTFATRARSGAVSSNVRSFIIYIFYPILTEWSEDPGFEQANQPTITDSDRRKLLNFCIVGAGPTGVEFAAELHDLLHTEIKRHYPVLFPLARISLFDTASTILGSFDEGLQE